MKIGYPSRAKPDADFHFRRAQQERALADAAADPSVRRAHLELATIHERSAASTTVGLQLVRDA